MAYQRLRLDFADRIAHLTLTGSTVDARLLEELPSSAAAIEAQEGISVVLIDCDGPDFVAAWTDDAIAMRMQPEAVVDPFGAIAALPMPVIAAIRGKAHNAGLELALACDIRVAAEDASFALTSLADGTSPLAGGSQRLPRIVGRARATSMILLGEVLDAGEAQRAGVVSRVFRNETFAADAMALARILASRGPVGLRYAKEAIHQGLDMPLDQALRLELDFSIILQTTKDRAEGVQAFIEKRPPQFEGR